jgi:hypothetical protein
MTVAGPRRICTGFLRRHRLTGNSVAPLNAVRTAVAQISALLPAALIKRDFAEHAKLTEHDFH